MNGLRRRFWTLPMASLLAAGACGSQEVPTVPEPSGEPREEAAQAGHASVRVPLPGPEVIAALPPDGGEEFNRLVFEASPYLRQHARNPVDWWPWGEAAFARAKELDRPIFLSVGYATCHWCHVMEHESFEDPEVAALMNELFVCVKVDREERPDVDQLYMSVTQAVTGRGGWPMTVVMTPELKPFFAGTYFPKTGRMGRGGMMDLVPELARAWDENRDEVEASAQRIVDFLERNATLPPIQLVDGKVELPGEGLAEQAFAELRASYDAEFGGFGQAPKFPVPHRMRFLMRYGERTGTPEAVDMAVYTLERMREGGVWDHVGHGFHRYSTDREWRLPHFEKMLYDQALMTLAFVEAWQILGRADLRATAEEILTYVLRDMTAPEGGFYSAEDADSEGEEGLFYLWTPEELVEVLGEKDGRFAAELFGVVAGGNFRDQATGEKTGESLLYRGAPLGEAWDDLGLGVDELAARVEDIRARLFEAREPRIHPLKDDKVLTDWNGLMIAAFARAGRAFAEPRYVDAARGAADFVLRELRDDTGALLKRWRAGEAGLPAVLDDYAFFVWGLIELYQASFDPRYLAAARELADRMIAEFGDEETGAFFLAPAGRDDLLVRAREMYDGALPSGNSVAALDLLLLARLTGDASLEERGARALAAAAHQASRGPSGHSQGLIALELARGPALEIVIAGDPASAETQAMLALVNGAFLPNAVVTLAPSSLTGEAAETLRGLAPWTDALVADGGRATAYVCSGYVCEQPTTSLAVLASHLSPSDAADESADD